MTNSKGYRRGTRKLFARKFRTHGLIPLSTYMRVYKLKDYVDIKGNGAAQKGMPHKAYHGKTGRVFNVTKRALGVIVHKRVKGRIIAKKINIRLEHVKPSKCRDDFVQRVKQNTIIRAQRRLTGKRIPYVKRRAALPRAAHVVKGHIEPVMLAPIPYEFIA